MSCDQRSCSHESHVHSDEHCACCCHTQCGCKCHKHQYSEELIYLADEAWMEVLKEKIKEEIKKQSGDYLTQLAQLVSNTNHKRWAEKMSEKKNLEDFKEHLRNLLCKK